VHKYDDEEQGDSLVLKALVQAGIWNKEIMNGTYSNYQEIAIAYGLKEEYVRRTLCLAFLSPKIKEAILFGKLPAQWCLLNLKRHRPSQNWDAQEAKFLSE
jgi:hypothetical protein